MPYETCKGEKTCENHKVTLSSQNMAVGYKRFDEIIVHFNPYKHKKIECTPDLHVEIKASPTIKARQMNGS